MFARADGYRAVSIVVMATVHDENPNSIAAHLRNMKDVSQWTDERIRESLDLTGENAASHSIRQDLPSVWRHTSLDVLEPRAAALETIRQGNPASR